MDVLQLSTRQQGSPSKKAVCSYSLPSSKSQMSHNLSTCIIQQYILNPWNIWLAASFKLECESRNTGQMQ